MSAATAIAARPDIRRPGSRMSPALLIALALGMFLVLAAVRTFTGGNDLTSSGTIAAGLSAAVPIGLAGLGGLWAERAGVVNIGLEGMMILGTWGCAYLGWNHGVWAGLAFGTLLGAAGGLVHAIATVTFGVDHIISGVAINIIAPGLTLYLTKVTFANYPGGGQKQSPPIGDAPSVTLPFSDWLRTVEDKHWFAVSDLAGVLGGLVTRLSLVTVLAVLVVIASAWILWRTAFGLRLRSCGEAPYAAESLGVNVYKYKYIAVIVSGALSGLGGAALAISAHQFRDGQTGGRGFIGLAALIFGNWRPGALAGGAGLFGYTDAIQLRSSAAVHPLLLLMAIALVLVAIWQWRSGQRVIAAIAVVIAVLAVLWYFDTDQVPEELVGTTPYVVTILVLALASQRLRMPKADGKVYRRGEET
ncbi:MAG TPA: ABC transporter permease [Jatrophihabitans sp.]|jgi:simple sugar transport system permease protein|uniref:ABC transporter permease n=1 Tax=Jatrophihabitans sp. TaxID=1932789 RepID=UPI002EEDF6CB